jgi:tol-pal system protein YbgF
MSVRATRLTPSVAFLAAGCFATTSDVRVLQTDVQTLRAERARTDSLMQQRLSEVVTALSAVNDSLGSLSGRLTRVQGDLRGDLFTLNRQLLQIQELTGQSQRRLQELRASLEARQQELMAQQTAPPPVATDSAAPAPAAPPPPGPHQLFQSSLDQLRRGNAATARTGFQELLQQHPTAEVAGEAQFYIGEALIAEGNVAAADSAYVATITKYPESPKAPTAMYKRALLLEQRGSTAAARAALNELIRKFPRSDEAALARDRLRTLK